MRKILFAGAIVILFVIAVECGWLFSSFAQDDGVDMLQPEFVYEQDEAGSVTSKVKAKTRKNEVFVEKNKLTGTPHFIITAGLEVPDKSMMKDAITALKNKTIDKARRLGVESLSSQQQNIDTQARAFIKNNKDILSVDNVNNLKLLNIQKVRGKAYVTYQQYYKDIPVYQAIIRLVITQEGKVPSCGSDYHKDIRISAIPDMTEEQALITAKVGSNFDEAKDKTVSDGLLILPLKEENNTYAYHLAYKLAVSKDNPPASWVYFIDAHTKEILVKYNNMKYETISGKVTGFMLPKYCNDNPQVAPFRDEYVTIKETGAKTPTDIDGVYSFSIGLGNYTISTSLEGPWAKVINEGGNTASYSSVVNAPSAFNISWGVSSATTQAEINVFYHINKIHDYVKNALKYDGMDWKIAAKVNISNCDTPYWNDEVNEIGFGENFGLFSDVVYHEYTHAVTDSIYKAGNIELPYEREYGAIHEGLSDYFACTINGDSVMGEGIKEENRNLDNDLKIPDDWRGEVHQDGRIIGGAFWDLRKSLGKELADELIHSARFGYPITFQGYLFQMLIADDDNGNIFDGTPHDSLIKDAFGKHGIYYLQLTEGDSIVSVGIGGRSSYTNYATWLFASWIVDGPFKRDAAEYRYKITKGSPTNGIIIRDWTSTGTNNRVSAVDLFLQHGKRNFFASLTSNQLHNYF